MARFKKGRSGNPGGRPKKSIKWDQAEQAVRDAIPRLVMMGKNELQRLLSDNPTVAEVLAAKYLTESPRQAVDRFLGKVAQPLTGADGAPLIPTPAIVPLLPPLDFSRWTETQVDKFIAATEAAAKVKRAKA